MVFQDLLPGWVLRLGLPACPNRRFLPIKRSPSASSCRCPAVAKPNISPSSTASATPPSDFPVLSTCARCGPARGSRNRRVVLRFENDDCRQAWLDSEDYRVWSARAEDLSDSAPRVANISGTAQEQPLSLVLTPLDEFVRTSVSGIGLLLVGTAVALVMANTHFADSYDRLWNTKLTIGTDDFRIVESLRHWVNDGLMALFFFIVGLEIKREVLVGELRQIRQAACPISAALGGAVAPALVYLLLNIGGARHGWGIPIGTDTAFSIGVLSLLGAR